MIKLKIAAEEFLAQQNIAITGVSRDPKDYSVGIANRFVDKGMNVYRVNPKAAEEGTPDFFPDLRSIHQKIDAVLILSHPKATLDIVKECAELGVKYVWMHKTFTPGSYDKEAVEYGQKHGVTVIPAGCPMMFGKTSDGFHRFCRFFMELGGRIPREIEEPDLLVV